MTNIVPEWAKIFPPDNFPKITKLLDGVSSSLDHLKWKSDQNHILIGRNPDSDIFVDEISCSRKHAIICYGNGPFNEGADFESYWVCDLGTQNGSHLNDNLKMEPHKFYLLKSGYFMQFGMNTIRYLFEYECECEREIVGVDTELESNLVKTESSNLSKSSNFADWGQNYDMEAEQEAAAIIVNKEPAPEIDNPIQVMKNYFKREGYNFSPNFVKLNTRFHTVFEATLILPIEDANNDESNETALTSQGDSKNEALHHVCKLAYELLHSRDLLNKQKSYANRKKRQLAENDYYDSDEDTFYDRTGSIEHKRDRRIQQNDTSSNISNAAFVSSSSSNYKSYFDKSSEYVPSKKINSRLSELNKHLIRVKSELQRSKNKKEQLTAEDVEDEAEQQMAVSEKAQLLVGIKTLNDKLKQLTKEREFLLNQLQHSKEIENNPELLKSVTNKNKTITKNQSKNPVNNSQQDHSIVEEIIKSYTHPTPIQKASIIQPKLEPLTSIVKLGEDPKLVTKLITKPVVSDKNLKTKKVDNNNVQNSKNEESNKQIDSNDRRDMIETDIEQLIDDSPISWTPQTESAMKHQDNLKDKYGY